MNCSLNEVKERLVVHFLHFISICLFQILLAGLCLPLFGYILAWLVAAYFQRSYEDRLAISIETGVQNTGIAIFMLRFSLGQPEADLTTGKLKMSRCFAPYLISLKM